jgi:hypothetical protein
MKRVPVDDDFPAADAEKAAEIDDGRAHYAGLSERRGLAAGPVIGMQNGDSETTSTTRVVMIWVATSADI